MGKALGLGRGKKAAKYALAGFNYLKDNPLNQSAQSLGLGANSALGGALGLGGQEGQEQAFNNFLNSIGYQSQLKAGQDAVSSSAAAQGMLNSGATLRRLQGVGQELAQQGYQQYLGNLLGLAGQGLSASNAVGAAGTEGGGAAASSQPQNTGILGRFFGI